MIIFNCLKIINKYFVLHHVYPLPLLKNTMDAQPLFSIEAQLRSVEKIACKLDEAQPHFPQVISSNAQPFLKYCSTSPQVMLN